MDGHPSNDVHIYHVGSKTSWERKLGSTTNKKELETLAFMSERWQGMQIKCIKFIRTEPKCKERDTIPMDCTCKRELDRIVKPHVAIVSDTT